MEKQLKVHWTSYVVAVIILPIYVCGMTYWYIKSKLSKNPKDKEYYKELIK